MSLSRASCETLKLTAFRLDEIEEPRPGVFRHKNSLGARISRLFPRPDPASTAPPAAPEPFAWHALDDLLPTLTPRTDR